MLIYIFLGLIFIGTLLLLPPYTHHGGGFTPFMTAMFTATSAITVTGLVIEDTATYWTRIGQVQILAMIFIGGLGYMTIATFFLMLLGRRITLPQRLLLRESLGMDRLGGLLRLAIGIAIVAVFVQLIGFASLLIRFISLYTPAEAVWQAAFHSVSAFNNAGFAAFTNPNGLIDFQGDFVTLGTISALVILGGIGYAVITDIARNRRFTRFSLNTKLVLVLTVALLAAGTVLFLAAEYDNPQTFGTLPVAQKAGLAFFESVNSRTAGFSAVDLNYSTQESNFFLIGLMFIGGATGSVAGGIKINTLAVLLVAVWTVIRGKQYATIFGREIPQAQVMRAVGIVSLATGFVFLIALFLTISEQEFEFIDLLFESVSAFGTVGLSTGITPDISSIGHLILIVDMFIGRFGPFTIAFAMANSAKGEAYRFAQENLNLG
jgi:trk system potassium uptake protein TrkH